MTDPLNIVADLLVQMASDLRADLEAGGTPCDDLPADPGERQWMCGVFSEVARILRLEGLAVRVVYSTVDGADTVSLRLDRSAVHG